MATIAEKWVQEAKKETTMEVIKKSLMEGLPIPTISRITGVPGEEISRLKQKMAPS